MDCFLIYGIEEILPSWIEDEEDFWTEVPPTAGELFAYGFIDDLPYEDEEDLPICPPDNQEGGSFPFSLPLAA